MRNDLVRQFTLRSTFLYNREIITDEFYEQLTWFHKIERSSQVMLYVTRKQFFDTLTEEIDLLGSMDVPTLMLWGKEDKSIGLSIGEELAGKLTGLGLEIIEEAGHCPNIDQYDQFNSLVLDFLAPSSTAG